MRDKERLHDYRFMAEPNLPPLRLYTNDSRPVGILSDQVINVDDIYLTMPELPSVKRQRLQEQHGLSVVHSNILVVSRRCAHRCHCSSVYIFSFHFLLK